MWHVSICTPRPGKWPSVLCGVCSSAISDHRARDRQSSPYSRLSPLARIRVPSIYSKTIAHDWNLRPGSRSPQGFSEEIRAFVQTNLRWKYCLLLVTVRHRHHRVQPGTTALVSTKHYRLHQDLKVSRLFVAQFSFMPFVCFGVCVISIFGKFYSFHFSLCSIAWLVAPV